MNGIKSSKNLDYNHAVRIDESVWWVGHYLPGDPFQCHVYLIDEGDQSVLIDPGSMLTIDKTLEKIEEVMPFGQIKYFIAHHQDPDITGALSKIDKMITRKDAVLLSHWRTNALLKHYNLDLPLKCVEEMGWELNLPGRKLKFVFTPYLHFAGAFTTYDEKTGTLFSSDLYGGFTEGWSLVAESEDYFDSIRLFHEHYMPSREILRHSISKFEKMDIKRIAPQHGSIIPENLVMPVTRKLKDLDCGLFLMAKDTTNLYRLSGLNRLLRNSFKILTTKRDFPEIKKALFLSIKALLPLKNLTFYIEEREGEISRLAEDDHESGDISISSLLLNKSMIGLSRVEWKKLYGDHFFILDKKILLIPLFSTETDKILSLSLLELEEAVDVDEELADVIDQIVFPLSVAVEREIILRKVTADKQKFYEQAIRDSLTGLYTRLYMDEAVNRLIKIHDRKESASFSVIMFDLDHFKRVNDSCGHAAGDRVLAAAASVILDCTRDEDINVRYGGEEFASFIVSSDSETAEVIAQRIRNEIEKMEINHDNKKIKITVSGGIAHRKQKESLEDVLERADKALYLAKESGRNCIKTHE